MDNWIIKIIDKGYKVTRDIYIYRYGSMGKVIMLDGQVRSEGEEPKPTLELSPEALQALADELANIGYKPQKGLVEGKLEAQTEHLKDLRKLLKL